MRYKLKSKARPEQLLKLVNVMEKRVVEKEGDQLRLSFNPWLVSCPTSSCMVK